MIIWITSFVKKKQYWSRPGDRLAECCNVECFMSTNSMWKVIKTMGLLTDHNGLKLKQVQFRGDFRSLHFAPKAKINLFCLRFHQDSSCSNWRYAMVWRKKLFQESILSTASTFALSIHLKSPLCKHIFGSSLTLIARYPFNDWRT